MSSSMVDMEFLYAVTVAAWALLKESSPFILFGVFIAGMVKVFLTPDYVASHLGKGMVKPVFKAALLGVPIPLCSCGVLPAAAQLRRQGANKGATAAFLIATPESGIDSIAVSWALLDPLMTIARPIAAFLSAVTAGIVENILDKEEDVPKSLVSLPMVSTSAPGCAANACGCTQKKGASGLIDKTVQGLRYAVTDLWGDLAAWFFVGLVMAACITVLIPEDFFIRYLSGGVSTMIVMLLVGIPMYVCATAATPIAAALILKGVSPGAALVFLLAGPATNATSLAVLVKILGKGGMAVYLASISLLSVVCGLALDGLYVALGTSAVATMGRAGEIIPPWLTLLSVLVLFCMSLLVLVRRCMVKA